MKVNKFIRFVRRMRWFFGVYMWPSHISTVQTWNGSLRFYSKDRTLGRCLHVERGFERELMEESFSFLKENNYIDKPEDGIVLDVGGYVGMSSIGFVKNNMFKGSVVFEPNPNNFRLVEDNIIKNNMNNNIRAYNIALSDSSGVVEMELSTKNYGDHRIRKTGDVENGYFGEHNRKIINVEATTLDMFLDKHKEILTDDIKLIWMDIQGYEGKFLRGAKNFIKNNEQTPVVMEFAPYTSERAGISKDSFCETIEELFSFFYILDEKCVVKYDVSEIKEIYDRYDSPRTGANLLMVNK